ncbi:MAG TPA: hypothetical protein VF121_00390 [Thermoanaerobaculia bacterium]|nr:hypothetical protein [Thermoanaerobaculia bacterium]
MSAPCAARSLLRSFGLAALALLLLAGAVELHPAEEAVSPLAGPQHYFPEAAHPEQPLHVEAAAAVERPHCTACFRGLQGRGAAPAAGLRQGIAPLPERPAGAASPAPLHAPRPSTRDRAPPSA